MKVNEIITEIEGYDETYRVTKEEHYFYVDKDTGDTLPLEVQHCFLRIQYIADASAGIYKDMSVNLLVKNATLPNEEAVYESKPPYMITEGQFKTDAEAEIAKDASIIRHEITVMKEAEEWMEIAARVFVSPNIVKRNYLVYRKKDNSIELLQIVSE